ncbi:MFS transporter [Novosphingobium sp. MD-1]|jgi:MFS family permease|uniref:spinster family MFS transporter n=1 Tax=Novosphingobium sp. MD-1 TaxID=1630648 RepID=UPI00061CCE83|nr:MFS transporter [Novosphingobium sp. MD-1]GAO54914.1 hypothetical protein NMD1_02016 [Novosphingobium sp. MD-1]
MEDPETPARGEKAPRIEPYSWYALGVLVIVYILNFIDRQLLTILAVDLKRDLGISDSEFGFLYGTAFGVFYALFGIPLGKLADRWTRTRLLAIGLAVWSAMTALSGLSRNFTQLGLARIGVGVGEASAGPSAYSLLSDYFPPRRRATAIAIYSAGIYLGGGVSLFIGSSIANAWNSGFAPGAHPFGLAGWQVAFLAVGLPGLLLAGWVNSLREPARGRYDPPAHRRAPPEGSPFKAFLADLGTIVPPFTLIAAARRGGGALTANIAAAAIIAALAAGITALLGDPVQWIALGVGSYAIFSWAASLRVQDPAAFAAIWKSPSVLGVTIGYGLISFVSYANSAFGPLYAIRTFHASTDEVAIMVGGLAAAGGAAGVIAGGAMADRLSRGHDNARRVLVVIGGLAAGLLPYAVMLTTDSKAVFYAMVFPTWFLLSAALGGASGTIVNIVPPQVRATATAAFLLGATMLGLALGPYAAGRLSTDFGSLKVGLVGVLAVVPIAFAALFIAWRALNRQHQGEG